MARSYRSVRVRLYPSQVNRLLHTPAGQVGRYFARVGGYVTREAQRLTAERLQRQTGQYAGGFRTTTLVVGGVLRTRITNSANHATFLERGTRPHMIYPRKGRYLVFTSRSGQLVFAKQVAHPGTRPYRILTDALRVGIRAAR